MISFVFMLLRIGQEATTISISLIGSGLGSYWIYGRIRETREFALLHIIERITAKELTTHSLETELKEIIRERDGILKDRFDHMIEACHVLDIDKSITMEEFFKLATDQMAKKLEVQPQVLLQLFLDREEESSTVLNPFLAIPHIIVDGKDHFDLLLARCREGIIFSQSISKVHTVFVIVGTKDQRTFHLRTLAAIAQIVQDPDFDKTWMAAKSIEGLRDIVLLGKRRREQ